MLLRLKNIGVMYHRLMNEIFKDLIRKIVKVYVDDILITLRALKDHSEDIRRVLNILDKIDMKLNIEKCTFKITQ